jgi:phage terminase small subunit
VAKQRPDYFTMPIEKLEGKLKPEERAFVEYYDQTGNGTLAAQRAGYSPDNKDAAAVAASRLLRRDKIIAYRRARAKELYEKLGLSKETLALKLERVLQQSLEGMPHMTYNPDTKEMEPDGTWVFDGRTATQALKLQGDLIGAYEQKISADVTTHSVEEFLATKYVPPMPGDDTDE